MYVDADPLLLNTVPQSDADNMFSARAIDGFIRAGTWAALRCRNQTSLRVILWATRWGDRVHRWAFLGYLYSIVLSLLMKSREVALHLSLENNAWLIGVLSLTPLTAE